MDRAHRLLICAGCAPASSFAVHIETALAAAGLATDIEVMATECLGVCVAPAAIGLQGHGKASYVFAGVAGEDDIADIVATCRLYLDSAGGWIEDARPCGRLRHLLRARLPALT